MSPYVSTKINFLSVTRPGHAQGWSSVLVMVGCGYGWDGIHLKGRRRVANAGSRLTPRVSADMNQLTKLRAINLTFSLASWQ